MINHLVYIIINPIVPKKSYKNKYSKTKTNVIPFPSGSRPWNTSHDPVRATGPDEEGDIRDELILVSGGSLRRSQGSHPYQGRVCWWNQTNSSILPQSGKNSFFVLHKCSHYVNLFGKV